MNSAIGIAAIILIAGIWHFHEKRRMNRMLEATFRDRESLSDDAFYAAFYKNSGVSLETVVGVRQVLAYELQIDVSRMIPSDDFSTNLRFILENDTMIDVALVEAIENRFKISISDNEAENTKTIHDLINFVHTKSQAE